VTGQDHFKKKSWGNPKSEPKEAVHSKNPMGLGSSIKKKGLRRYGTRHRTETCEPLLRGRVR